MTNRLATEINRELARLTERHEAALSPYLHESVRALKERLRWLSRRGRGERFEAYRIRSALVQMRDYLRENVDDAATTLHGAAAAASKGADVAMRKQLVSLKDRFGDAPPLDFELAREFALGERALLLRYERSAAKWGGAAYDNVRRSLARAQLEGQTWFQAGRTLAERVGVSAHEGERLVRTEMVKAHSDRTVAVAEASDYDLKWNAALYRSCPICKKLDGEVTSPRKGFPGGYGASPAHPN